MSNTLRQRDRPVAVKFLILQNQKSDPPPDSKIFRNRNAHLYRLVRELTPGNGSIERRG